MYFGTCSGPVNQRKTRASVGLVVFTGHEFDADTGLNYMDARYHSEKTAVRRSLRTISSRQPRPPSMELCRYRQWQRGIGLSHGCGTDCPSAPCVPKHLAGSFHAL